MHHEPVRRTATIIVFPTARRALPDIHSLEQTVCENVISQPQAIYSKSAWYHEAEIQLPPHPPRKS